MVDYTIAAQTPQASQAVNPMQTMTQYQGLANAMLQNQQAKRQMQTQNALTDILGRSGGVFSPQVYKDLVASGNVDAALKMQHHNASMGSIGVHTAAANVALEKARLELKDTKRELAAGAASRDYIAQNDDLADPVKLKNLRLLNPDAHERVVKLLNLTTKAGYEASTAKRLDDKAKLEMAQATMALFAPAFATTKTEDKFFKLYDQLASKYEAIGTIAPREFTPDAVRSLVQAGANLQDLEDITIGGLPATRNKRTGQIHMSEIAELGANAAPGQQASVVPPVAPVASAPASPMAPTVANALAQNLPGAAPAANAMVAQPAAPQTVTQLLAAQKERELAQKEAEAAAQARGTAAGKVVAEELALTPQIDAAVKNIQDAIKPGGLLDKATGSGVGNIIDKSLGFLSVATGGAIANAELKPIADLALKLVPRFEGSQSNDDRKAYEDAAGALADATNPIEIRRAAAKTVVRLLQERRDQFGVNKGQGGEGMPGERRASAGPVTVQIPGGKSFSFPDKAAADKFRKEAGL